MLAGKEQRRDELFEIAREPRAAEPEEDLMVLIEEKPVPRPVNGKLVDGRAHLRRKCEIRRRALPFADDDPQLIDELGLADTPQQRTHESVGDHVG